MENVPNGTKSVQGNKKCAREQKMCKRPKNVQGNKKYAHGTKQVPLSKNEVYKETMWAKCNLLWNIMVLNCCVCLVWLCVALCGHVWPYVASYGLVAFHLHNMTGIV